MWFLAVLFAVFSPLGVAACNLSSLLGGPALGVYYASYQETASFPLASIAAPVNMVLLSFAQPNTGYSAGSYTLSGTGLNFVSTFAQVKANVATLKSRGFVVMLSAGGATYFWDKPAFNATALAALATDLGCNGIDIDWEDGIGKSTELGPIISALRAALPRPGCLSLSAFYTGAFPTTDTTHSHFSPYASEAVPGLDSDGTLLDFVNVQAYDGGPEFSPAAAFDAYRKVFAGPMLLGMSAAVESYGGFVVSNATALADAKHVWADGVAGNGVFVWNWQDSQKHAPTALQIVQVAHAFFNTARVTPPSPPSPPRPPPPLPHSPPPPPKPKHRPPPPHPKPKGKGR